MTEEELKSALSTALSQGWPEGTGYVLSLLAHCLAAAARPHCGRADGGPEAAAKLSALAEVQYAVTGRLLDLLMYRDEWSDAAFVEELFVVARRGGCEQELSSELREVLTVIALHRQRAREE